MTTTATTTPVTIAEYTDYADAQRAVHRLSNNGFPVEGVRIVGHDMKSVELVTGRMTTGRAAGIGALSGAWFGLLLALLVGLFVPAPAWLSIMLAGVLLGAVWGAIFGFVGHWATRNRDFSSEQLMVASRYELLVEPSLASEAREQLGLR